ncbi:MAG: hypothetical protein IPH58_05475 [Sphingobacteriales bacterium]|nr:hypothetical protein [Sphingobacteriales bacterium]
MKPLALLIILYAATTAAQPVLHSPYGQSVTLHRTGPGSPYRILEQELDKRKALYLAQKLVWEERLCRRKNPWCAMATPAARFDPYQPEIDFYNRYLRLHRAAQQRAVDSARQADALQKQLAYYARLARQDSARRAADSARAIAEAIAAQEKRTADSLQAIARQKEDAQRKARLLKKYGPATGTRLYKGQVQPGDTRQMATDALGEYHTVQTVRTAGKTTETWNFYPWRLLHVVLVNGRVAEVREGFR